MDHNHALKFRCVRSGHELKLAPGIYSCPECRSNLEIIYDYPAIKRSMNAKVLRSRKDLTLFRYREFFPVRFDPKKYLKLCLGLTPLFRAGNLEKALGIKDVWLKDESRNPSGSLKDRASLMAIIHAGESGHSFMIASSTGNAASSLACLSAPMNMKNLIFVPRSIPRAKLSQLLVFGAGVVLVNGSYDDAFELSRKLTEKNGYYNRNTGFNPFTREGKKTVSFEIIEQMAGQVPDYVFVPVGDGNILSGVWKGFMDFYSAGLIRSLPKLIAVQSSRSAAIASAFLRNRPVRKVKASTIADSISVNFPRDGELALKALRESEGRAVIVSDREILLAQSLLARAQGVFAEPAGAACLAGLIKASKEKKIAGKSTKVLLVTGSGLKDIDAIMKRSRSPELIEPSLAMAEKWMHAHASLHRTS